MYASHMSRRSSVVTRLHSFELHQWAPRINWDSVNRVILVSQAMRRRFVDLYPEHGHRTGVGYNGWSLDQFQPSLHREFKVPLFDSCYSCTTSQIKGI